MTHRFVVGPALALSREQARQIATVLRLRAGDVVTLLAEGEEIEYRLERVSPESVAGTVVSRRRSQTEPSDREADAVRVAAPDTRAVAVGRALV